MQCTGESTAIYCNEQGTELVTVECGSDCDPARDGCFCEAETSVCSDDQAIHCGEDGKVSEIEACALGCNDTGERCVDVEPSNGLAGYLDMTDDAPAVSLSNGAVIDTDAGTITDGDGAKIDVPDFQIAAPTGGVAIRVFAVKSLQLGDATIAGIRAIAVVSDGDIVVGGHVRIRAGSSTEGACVGGFGGQDDPGTFQADAGGGGGGFGGSGGDGGDAIAGDASAGGGQGGSPIGNSSLVPLRGGCAGGGLVDDLGASGGGAIQLVSRTSIRIEDGSAEAHLDAGGEGSGGIAGGGSGGGILLEAPRVIVSSGTSVVANGGGGGSISGANGQDGTLTNAPAAGGCPTGCAKFGFGSGGDGGAAGSPAQDGQSISSGTLTLVIAGSGGGGIGRIRVNVPVASEFVRNGIVSPSASLGSIATR